MRDLKHSLEGLSGFSEATHKEAAATRTLGRDLWKQNQSEDVFENEPRGLISLPSRLTTAQDTEHVKTMEHRAEEISRYDRGEEIHSRALNRESDPIRWCRQRRSQPKYGDKPTVMRERR